MGNGNSGFEGRINSIHSEVRRLQREVTANTTANTTFLSGHLQLALVKLYQLTVSIRGDYDSHQDDGSERTASLFEELVSECKSIDARTELSLDELSKEHEKAVEIHNNEIIPLQNELEQEEKAVANEIASLEQQIKAINEEVERDRRTLSDEAKSLQSLSQKLADAEATYNGVDIGFSILIPIWGIVNAIDHSKGPGSVLGLRSQVEDARLAVDKARDALNSTSRQLRQLEVKRMDVLEREHAQQKTASELSGLVELANAALSRIKTMETSLTKAKQSSAEAVRRAGELSNAASLNAHMAVSKQEIAEGILDVLETLVMEPKAALTSRKIIDELVNNYGSTGVPKIVQVRCDAILAKLAHFG